MSIFLPLGFSMLIGKSRTERENALLDVRTVVLLLETACSTSSISFTSLVSLFWFFKLQAYSFLFFLEQNWNLDMRSSLVKLDWKGAWQWPPLKVGVKAALGQFSNCVSWPLKLEKYQWNESWNYSAFLFFTTILIIEFHSFKTKWFLEVLNK